MPYKVKKRRKFYDLSHEQWQDIKYDASEAYHMGWPENPYPKYSDAWEAWDRGIEYCRRLDDY